MGRLIRVRRADKNGVMTTKWVLPPSEPNAGVGSIPAPAAVSSPRKLYSPRSGSEIDLEESDLYGVYRKSMLKHSRQLRDLDPQVLQAVETLLQESIGRGVGYQADTEVATAFNMVHSAVEKDAPDEYTALNNLAIFGDAVINPDSHNYEVQALVAGIQGPGNVKDYLLDAIDEEREQVLTLMTAAARLKQPFVMVIGGYYDNDRSIRITSPYLQDFILSRPDDVEEIASIVNERETDDVDVIRDILDHNQRALRGGVL